MRKNRGKRNKTMGHNAERYYAQVFREMGFKFCTTSRLGSRLHDNAKIDLINLPFNLQIKAGKQQSMNPGKELFAMSTMIKSLFPPEDPVHSKACYLVHKKPIGTGNKPTPEHEIVFMSKRQFLEYEKEVDNLSFLFEKKFKFEFDSEFRHVVAITFESFKEKIINKFYLNGSNSNT